MSYPHGLLSGAVPLRWKKALGIELVNPLRPNGLRLKQEKGTPPLGVPSIYRKKEFCTLSTWFSTLSYTSRFWYSSALPTRPTADREALEKSISSSARARTSSRVTAS